MGGMGRCGQPGDEVRFSGERRIRDGHPEACPDRSLKKIELEVIPNLC